ncbi:hypothetical protein C8R45DRAFT_989494 [Mycena sanguinolenta]|nr:hypothetical protein C8R45DRAFT_989494 [Mycena sanguinolenta]
MAPAQYTANSARRPVISTVVPNELSDILKRFGGNSSQLGRNLIEYQLKSYDEYISAPARVITDARVPSLVDLAAEKFSSMTEDTLDEVPDVVLSRHIWNWHSGISYAMFRRTLTRLAAPKEPPKKRQKTETKELEGKTEKEDIDEWILSHEKSLGDNERLGKEWQHGLITLKGCDSVFPSSVKKAKARTITRRPDFPGYNILDATRSLTVDIQPSVAAFRRTFDRMSDGLLKNLNWNNIIVAGGIVLGVLLSVGGAAEEEWAASDIDIYIYGLTPAQANKKISELFATFKANLPKGSPVLIVRNSKTITFFSKYPLRRIQIVLKLVKSPRAVLLNFDLDICAMCWDGSEFWMLPRAARALETGYNVFTMNMIQGHYLSERRATQEQRVFKYADRGYGVRILPSYLSSLEESKSKLPEISRGEILFGVDIDKIGAASRIWTRTVVGALRGRSVAHAELDNDGQLSSEPQGRSCLSGFSLFMRHVALWEMGQAGEIETDKRNWASTNYEDYTQSILAYDDTPSYTWSESFTIADFQRQIEHFNAQHIARWIQEDYHATSEFRETHGIGEEDDIDLDKIFQGAARLTCAQDMKTILSAKSDIGMPVVVPRNLAAYMNHLVGEAQKAAKMNVQPILTPAVKDDEDVMVPLDSTDSADGLYMWRIGKDIMWQQLDRRIDEVFEVLYAFYRANDRLINDYNATRLITQLSKRAIRSTVDDEFEAFARWIGRQPIFVQYFWKTVDDEIEGQEEQYTAKY